MRHALLVIDVQQSLCQGPWAAWEADALIARINTATARARAAGWPVVWVQHEAPHPALQHGSPGWQLADGLDLQPADARVRKTTSDSFHHTELKPLLDSLGVQALAVCGLQTEFCVDTSTRRALALGYPVTLLADAHSTQDNGVLSAAQIRAHHNHTLANMESFGPRVSVVAVADWWPTV